MENSDFSDIDLSDYKLENIIDVESLDNLLDIFCDLTGYGVGIIDLGGKVLVAKKWQNICVQFHRLDPRSCKNCLESDTLLSSGIEPGKYKLYKCKNNMWDMATPIYIDGRHMGNIFLGQFFYDDDEIDYDLFAQQAELYGFDKKAYMKALKEVPVWSREVVNKTMSFYSKFAEIISDLGYQNLLLKKILKERKKELDESKNKLNAILKSMNEMVVLYEIILDSEHRPIDYQIMDCNKVFLDTFQLKTEDIMGKKASELPQIKPELYLQDYHQVIGEQENFEHLEYIPAINKSFIVSVCPTETNQFITISTDVTEISEMQEVLASKNKELENYLYVASHDLRSPLVNIQGFSQRLKKQTDMIHKLLLNEKLDDGIKDQINAVFDQKIPETLNYVFNNIAKMDSLIKGLLTISRTGRTEMEIASVDMNKLFQRIIDGINFQIQDKKINCTIENLPDCFGDYNLLNRLFTNIIDNAIKYRDKKRELVIRISGEINNNYSVYKIEDTGIGIAERHLKKIWDVFYRVDPLNSENGEGLGLSIVKTIVDKHKGKVSMTSEEGSGTCTTIKIPNIPF